MHFVFSAGCNTLQSLVSSSWNFCHFSYEVQEKLQDGGWYWRCCVIKGSKATKRTQNNYTKIIKLDQKIMGRYAEIPNLVTEICNELNKCLSCHCCCHFSASVHEYCFSCSLRHAVTIGEYRIKLKRSSITEQQFSFALQILSETFLIRRWSQWDIVIKVRGYFREIPVIPFRF